jgi:hypothetical protein
MRHDSTKTTDNTTIVGFPSRSADQKFLLSKFSGISVEVSRMLFFILSRVGRFCSYIPIPIQWSQLDHVSVDTDKIPMKIGSSGHSIGIYKVIGRINLQVTEPEAASNNPTIKTHTLLTRSYVLPNS